MNTIYEYYIKVSDRFYYFNGRHLWEPMVRGIVLQGFETFDFFILKSNHGYFLCEGLTGMVILHQKDMHSKILRHMGLREFIKVLPELLTNIGIGNINNMISNFIIDNQISPRYEHKL